MDDFERKINIGSKEKYCEILIEIIWKTFLTDTLAKMSQNIFAYSLVSEYLSFFYLRKKNHFSGPLRIQDLFTCSISTNDKVNICTFKELFFALKGLCAKFR